METILPGERRNNFSSSSVIEKSLDDLHLFVKTSKIGWFAEWGGSLPFEYDVLPHCESTLNLFQSKGGASIEYIPDAPFPNHDLWDSWTVIRSHNIFNLLRGRIGCDASEVLSKLKACGVKPEAIWECKHGELVTQQQVEVALKIAHNWSVCADDMFKSFDLLALPSSQVYPFAAEDNWPKIIAGKKMGTYHRWMNAMVPVTLFGLPCVTIPAGMGPETGLPMGLHIFAQKGKDKHLLQLA